GHLFRVPVSIDNDGNATFGDPEPGVMDFRPVAMPETGEPVAASRGARFSTPASAGRPKDRVRAGTAPNERSSDVDISTLREQLDMPDATEDEVIAAAAERLSTTPAPEAEETVPEVTPATPVAASAGA